MERGEGRVGETREVGRKGYVEEKWKVKRRWGQMGEEGRGKGRWGADRRMRRCSCRMQEAEHSWGIMYPIQELAPIEHSDWTRGFPWLLTYSITALRLFTSCITLPGWVLVQHQNPTGFSSMERFSYRRTHSVTAVLTLMSIASCDAELCSLLCLRGWLLAGRHDWEPQRDTDQKVELV